MHESGGFLQILVSALNHNSTHLLERSGGDRIVLVGASIAEKGANSGEKGANSSEKGATLGERYCPDFT